MTTPQQGGAVRLSGQGGQPILIDPHIAAQRPLRRHVAHQQANRPIAVGLQAERPLKLQNTAQQRGQHQGFRQQFMHPRIAADLTLPAQNAVQAAIQLHQTAVQTAIGAEERLNGIRLTQ
jgi:hypothetical protein